MRRRLRQLRDSWKALSWIDKLVVITVAMLCGIIVYGVIINAEPIFIWILLAGLIVLLSVIVIVTVAYQKRETS